MWALLGKTTHLSVGANFLFTFGVDVLVLVWLFVS